MTLVVMITAFGNCNMAVSVNTQAHRYIVLFQLSKHIHPKLDRDLRLHGLQGLFRSLPGIKEKYQSLAFCSYVLIIPASS